MNWLHRKSRGRKGTGKKGMKNFAQTAVTKYASERLQNRWAMLCPFPLDKREIYQTLFSDEQHKAIDLLVRTAPSMITTNSEVCLKFDIPFRTTVRGKGAEPQRLIVKLGTAYPLPDTGAVFRDGEHEYLASQLPAQLREPLEEWAKRWLIAALETRQTSAKLYQLFEMCSTIGQVKRVWPNACNMLPEDAQAKLRDAKVKSPYPDDALETIGYRDDGSDIKRLKDEWSPKTLEWFDDRITEAMCLPYDADNDPDGDAQIVFTTT